MTDWPDASVSRGFCTLNREGLKALRLNGPIAETFGRGNMPQPEQAAIFLRFPKIGSLFPKSPIWWSLFRAESGQLKWSEPQKSEESQLSRLPGRPTTPFQLQPN